MTQPVITEKDFTMFRDFFFRKTGIMFENNKRYFVDSRLIERINVTKASDFKKYFEHLCLRSSANELQELTNLMTVNETYFFRESHQFDCMVNSILPEIVKNKVQTEPIRIWSIPSSTGEEPYTIAINLLERWPEISTYDVEIIASDIDTRVLDVAKKGVYSQRSVQNIPAEYLSKYFKKTLSNEFQICDDLRQSVTFTHVNLNSEKETAAYRNIDLVFCRNLLIYFDDYSRRMAAETFYDALNPGGFICLGHSESMSRISNLFSVRKFKDAVVYQKDKKVKL